MIRGRLEAGAGCWGCLVGILALAVIGAGIVAIQGLVPLGVGLIFAGCVLLRVALSMRG